MRLLFSCPRIVYDAFVAFIRDDGWAIASHIALSLLMSLFPFLIFVTALTGFLGTQNLSDQVALLLLEAWPEEVSGPIVERDRERADHAHSGLLTIGAALALYFSTNGIESLRIGLNRAYGVVEMRSWWLLRLESIAYMLVAALALIALSFLIVLGPLILRTATRYFPGLSQFEGTLTFLRFGVATVVLVICARARAQMAAGRQTLAGRHRPGHRRHARDVAHHRRAVRTLSRRVRGTYVTMYAGLASAMIALVFLYWTATIFIYGGELNAVIVNLRQQRKSETDAA